MSDVKIQLRRDLANNWQGVNPVLADGEMGIETDTRKFKFGDGNTKWNSLPYASNQTSDIPTKLSQLDNDCNFITETAVSDITGDLTTLYTEDKATLVAAINELVERVARLEQEESE